MCSIIGYFGEKIAAPIIVNGLKCMEYRGYDSVGVATIMNKQLLIKKGSGKVSEVNSNLHLEELAGIIGIGHTRWATHGEANSINAHPHLSTSRKIAIAHNGIIENYQEIKNRLRESGHKFQSDTDSEVISNLLEFHYKNGDVKKAIIKTVSELKGDYAFVAMFDDGTLAATRYHEPLIIGVGNHGYFVSSDVLGLTDHTDKVIYPDNKEFVIISRKGIEMYNFNGGFVHHEITKVAKDFTNAHKGDYPHYTLKEIFEQPQSILEAGKKFEAELERASDIIINSENIALTGSGTSFNACLVGRYLLAKYAKLRSDCLISSEIPFMDNNFGDKSILVALSQSGESADVIEAVNTAEQKKSKIISVVNVHTSSLAKIGNPFIGTSCGPEIGVAATKSFTSQLAVLYKITEKIMKKKIVDFHEISEKIQTILNEKNNIQKIAKSLSTTSDIYIIGRGIHYPIASEAALKLKELTYIHAEAIPAGELKHGPLALMDSNAFVIVFNPTDHTYHNTLSSIHEIKARKAKIIGISDEPNKLYDYWIKIPKTTEAGIPILETIPIQLLSYYTSIEKNTDPDYPRNLAKSVTVK